MNRITTTLARRVPAKTQRRSAGMDNLNLSATKASCWKPRDRARWWKASLLRCGRFPLRRRKCGQPIARVSRKGLDLMHALQPTNSPLKKAELAPRTRRRGRYRVKNGLIQAVFTPFDRSRRGSRRQGGLFQRAANRLVFSAAVPSARGDGFLFSAGGRPPVQ